MEGLTSENEMLKKQVESLQSHYERYSRSIDDLGAKDECIKKDHEMQVLRIFNQSKQIKDLDSQLEEEKRERMRLYKLVKDHENLISSLRRQVKDLTDSIEYYRRQRNEYREKFGLLPQ